MEELTIGQVASITGVTVRTLRHYDDIGLVTPSHRDSSGYRRYDEADVARLQRALAYRAMDLDLASIADLLDSDGDEAVGQLDAQLARLRARIAGLQRVEQTLDATLRAHRIGLTLSGEEMLDVFGEFDPSVYADEVQERWGDMDAYGESTRRTKGYTKDDWLQCQAEGEAAVQLMLAAFTAGEDAGSDLARQGALAHRAHIDRWFYPCSAEMQCGLADMYVADERFTATYEAYAPGFARFVNEAIYAAALT